MHIRKKKIIPVITVLILCRCCCSYFIIINIVLIISNHSTQGRVYGVGAGVALPRHRQKTLKKDVRRGHPEYLKCSKTVWWTPLGRLQRSHRPPSWWEGGWLLPSPKHHPRSLWASQLGPLGLEPRPFGSRFRPINKS